MCGPTFSGKTYLAKQLSERLNLSYISYDDIWEEKNIELDKWLSWEQVTKIAHKRISTQLKEGKSVIYDDLADAYESREKLRELAEKFDAEGIIIWLETSQETRQKRYTKNQITQERHHISRKRFVGSDKRFDVVQKDEKSITFCEGEDLAQWVEKLAL